MPGLLKARAGSILTICSFFFTQALRIMLRSIPVTIYHTQITEPLPPHKWKRLFTHLSDNQKDRNQQYHRWQDRHAHLFGKLLLLRGLTRDFDEQADLDLIRQDRYGKPFLRGAVEFNISHSGAYVLCAIGRNVKLGVDIEAVNTIDLDHYRSTMTAAQWDIIERAPNPIRKFFDIWTLKESVIKADSRGLQIPLQDISTDGDRVICDGNPWYTKSIFFDNAYCSHLAADTSELSIRLKPVCF